METNNQNQEEIQSEGMQTIEESGKNPIDAVNSKQDKGEVERRKALRAILSASTLLVINPFKVGAQSKEFFMTVTPTPTPSSSTTPTPTASNTPTPSPSSSSPLPSSTPTPTPSTSTTSTPTPTPTPSTSTTSTPTPTPSTSATSTPTPTPSTSTTSTPTPTPSTSSTPTPTPSSSTTPTPTPSSSSAPLPVEISEFGVKEENGFLNLYWRTESEQQNRGFEIQRSTDSLLFTQIGWVDGVGNSSRSQFYNFEEFNVEANRWYYYRLKQVDFNGTSHLSKTVAIMLNEESKTTLKDISPTVVTENYVNIEITSGTNNNVEITILNLQGQEISHQRISLSKGYNSTKMDLGNAASGLYSVHMRLRNGDTQTKRFLVQR